MDMEKHQIIQVAKVAYKELISITKDYEMIQRTKVGRNVVFYQALQIKGTMDEIIMANAPEERMNRKYPQLNGFDSTQDVVTLQSASRDEPNFQVLLKTSTLKRSIQKKRRWNYVEVSSIFPIYDIAVYLQLWIGPDTKHICRAQWSAGMGAMLSFVSD